MRLGQRFESARRFSVFDLYTPNTGHSPWLPLVTRVAGLPCRIVAQFPLWAYFAKKPPAIHRPPVARDILRPQVTATFAFVCLVTVLIQ